MPGLGLPKGERRQASRKRRERRRWSPFPPAGRLSASSFFSLTLSFDGATAEEHLLPIDLPHDAADDIFHREARVLFVPENRQTGRGSGDGTKWNGARGRKQTRPSWAGIQG